ncbi:hypothetical protein VPNG_01017 [Cytospora leucostoma]|uniref:Uncharacterized protein n=1 Tax=Cytospora leucostoma TaxID=1230097 RepID=A0A423XLU5_9PEZI|nr:hypothetical protein VPNG_01017 [Cytospora leucostoma]
MGSSGVGDEVIPEAPRHGESPQGSSPASSPSPPTPPGQQSPQDTSADQQGQQEAESGQSNGRASSSTTEPRESTESSCDFYPSKCSVLTWGSRAADDGQQLPTLPAAADCRSKPLGTPDDLRNEIAGLLAERDAPQATTAADTEPSFSLRSSVTATGHEEQQHREQHQEMRITSQRRPLMVFRNPPEPFTRTILDSPLGIDPAFIAARVDGRRYRPRGIHKRRGGTSMWIYPELWTSYRQENLVMVFYRASLLANAEGLVDVLFLDGEVGWNMGSRNLRRVGDRQGRVATESGRAECVEAEGGSQSGGLTGYATDIIRETGDGTPSLEEGLREEVGEDEEVKGGIENILEETAYEYWLDFLEVLMPRRSAAILDETSLEWQAMRALEANADMSRDVARRSKSPDTAFTRPDWEGLTRRLQLRVQMLALVPPRPRTPGRMTTIDSSEDLSLPFGHSPVVRRTEIARSLAAASSDIGKPSPGIADEDQRSIDRVTYLGGILLPFTVVAGVLSMNDIFEPGGRLFWVFWVASIPLAAFTVLLIFIDKLSQRFVVVPDDSDDEKRYRDKIEKLPPRPSLPPRRGAVRHSAAPDDHVDLELGASQMIATPTPPEVPVERLQRLSDGDFVLYPERVSIVSGAHNHPFAETLAAGLEGSGFVPDIVLEGYIRVVSEERPAYKNVHGGEGPRPRIQRLGWGGAVLSILGVRKPLMVSGSNPESAVAEAYRRRQRRTKRGQ